MPAKRMLRPKGPQIGHRSLFPDNVNDLQQVVGASKVDGDHEHAFLYENGVMTDWGVLPGANGSQSLGFNNLGQIVGSLVLMMFGLLALPLLARRLAARNSPQGRYSATSGGTVRPAFL